MWIFDTLLHLLISTRRWHHYRAARCPIGRSYHLTAVCGLKCIQETQAEAIVLSPESPETPIPTLISKNPYLTFAQAIELFYSPPEPIPGIHPTAVVARTAQIGDNCCIGPNAVVSEGVMLGANATLHANVVIYPEAKIGDDFLAHANAVVREHCRIGNRVVLQNGAVVGAASLVTPGTEIRARELAFGSPAKTVREVTDEEASRTAHELQAVMDKARSYRRNGPSQ